MTNLTASNRYARALLDVAIREKSDLEQVEHDLAGFVGLFAEHPLLAKVMLNPAVPVPRKRAVVAELSSLTKPHPSVSKLLMLLAERDRLVLLPALLDAYRARLLDHQGVVRAHITTAAPLAADRTQAIERNLARVTGRTVTVQTKVDPSIIGGVVTRVGSTVYDGSITRQLEKMKARLLQIV